MKIPVARFILFTLLASLASALAGDLHFQPSKITFAKKHGWEPLASKWMSSEELKNYAENQKAKQMIFIDYNGVNYRGLFTDKIKYGGWYYMEVFEEKDMAKEIASYKEKGFVPSYVYKNAGGFTAVFVPPDQLSQARKILDDLGIGPAVVKE